MAITLLQSQVRLLEAQIAEASYTAEVPDELTLWIDRLIQIESGGRENIKILDVNGKYSYGCLQFQRATFVGYSKQYGFFGNLKEVDWDKEIMNCRTQKTLLRNMLADDYKNYDHWRNSVKKLGKPPLPVDN